MVKYLSKKTMKKIIRTAFVAACFTLAFTTAFAAHWKVKNNYSVKFSSGKIKGSFKNLQANILFDRAHPEQAKISASVEANSIATGFFLKNSHAKDALGADQNPDIRFVSTSVSRSGSGYNANGRLTLRRTTRPAVIHFTFTEHGNQGEFKGTLKVIPREFKIDRSGTPSQVMVYLTVPVIKG